MLGVEALVRVRVHDLDLRNPSIDEDIESFPRHPASLKAKDVRQLKAEGMSHSEIAKRLGKGGRPSGAVLAAD